jgi:hypothetical protein
MIGYGKAPGVTKSLSRRSSAREQGYTLLMVVFLTATLLLTATASTPSLILRGRREKEEEMIWRGKQYERGIRLFYAKNHRLPNSIEELTNSNGLPRVMRKAYKDPMNPEDGSWRLIYVGSAGELIGSTRPAAAYFKLGVPGGINTPSASSGLQNASATGGGPALQLASAVTPSASNSGELAPAEQTFGGKIIGVGSKIDKRSIIWWNGAQNYLQFEFVWDPSKYGMGVNPARLASAVADGQQPQPTPGQQQPQTDQPRFPNAVRDAPDVPSNPQP